MKRIITALSLLAIAFSSYATIHTVAVQNYSYAPAQQNINLGDTVRFIWIAGDNHPTQANDGSWAFNMDANHLTYDLILTTLGDHPYHCVPHQGMGMVGNITVNAPTSAPAMVKKNSVSVFPNPANHQVTVSHNFSNVDGVRVTNMIGQQVRFAKPQFGSNNQIQINIADLPKGIYLVNLQVKGSTVFTQRLVKDR